MALDELFIASEEGMKQKEIAKILLGDTDYAGLSKFFNEVLDSSYPYKVAVARRCFNLIYAFGVGDCDGKDPDIISDNALIMYAEDFAKEYCWTGRFPRLLVIDDVMIHGRAIYSALARMETQILESLHLLGKTNVRLRDVHLAMLSAVDIRVYAIGDGKDIIDNSYLFNVKYAQRRYGSEMLQLSRNLSTFLNFCGAANTSHLLSVRLNQEESEIASSGSTSPSWEALAWNYNGYEEKAFFLGCAGREMQGVHVFRRGIIEDVDYWAMGFPCIEEIATDELNNICAEVLKLFDKDYADSQLAKTLSSESVGTLPYKMQFVSLIDSAAALHRFCVEVLECRDWKSFLGTSDMNRICHNFGFANDAYGPVQSIMLNERSIDELSHAIHNSAKCIGNDVVVRDTEVGKGLVWAAENLISDVGMKAEEEAFEFSRNRKTFNPLAKGTGSISFGSYLDHMNEQNGLRTSRSLSSVAIEMSLLRYGINAVRYETSGAKDERACCLLKAGELSIQSFPQRHSDVLPALTRIDRWAKLKNKTLNGSIQEFVASLDASGTDGMISEETIEDLKNMLPNYARQTYACAKGFGQWCELRWTGDGPSRETDYSYSAYSARCRYYIRKVNKVLG